MDNLNNTKKIRIDLPMNLIQGIRFAHALMESSYTLSVSKQDAKKLSLLTSLFNIDFSTDVSDALKLNSFSLSHIEPFCRIGSIKRDLIFPHAAFEYCRKTWADYRPVRFIFAGKITDSRHETLQRWINRSFPDDKIMVPKHTDICSPLRRFVPKSLRNFLSPAVCEIKSRQVLLQTSQKGRNFFIKTWDELYYKNLGQAEFALCPNGAYIWTYRFFEAIMCGAIPVVQDVCDAYEGFRYFTMENPTEVMRWSEADANHNFTLCQKRLTVPLDELNYEIGRLYELEKQKIQLAFKSNDL